jgi:alpha-2-macroglobulin
MKHWIWTLWMAAILSRFLCAQTPLAGTDPFCPESAAADRLYAEGSFALAAERYQALVSELPPQSLPGRWVELRRHAARWRDLAARRERDGTLLEAERLALEKLLEPVERPEQQDRIWAETQEALGDFHWLSGTGWRGQADGFYQAAFDFWARSTELELARARWLAIARRVAAPPWDSDPLNAGQHGMQLSIDRLEQAQRIATSSADQGLFGLLLGRGLLDQGAGRVQDQRGLELLRQVRAEGMEREIAAAALLLEARWWQQVGPWVNGPDGLPRREPDLERALALYREFLATHKEGQSRYRRDVEKTIEQLLAEELEVSIPTSFRAGQPVSFAVSWRNVSELRGRLVALNLTQDVVLGKADHEPERWIEYLALDQSEPFASFSKVLPEVRLHQSGSASLRLADLVPQALPAGAYALELRAGRQSKRALVLITDQVLLLEQAPGELLAFVVDAERGAPRAGQPVRAWVRLGNHNDRRWKRFDGSTDAQGLARFSDPILAESSNVLVTTGSGGSQAFCSSYGSSYTPEQGWRLLVTTDRPAYRPGQGVSWKVTARRHTGLAYSTPAGEQLKVEIVDPRGEIVHKQALALSEFGTAHGQLETGATWTLGAYQVRFFLADGSSIGTAQLLQLEEYKLPEFEVSVRMAPGSDGQPQVFVLGDVLQAQIEARTYFGAAVAGGAVELIVSRQPLYAGLTPEPRFGWFERELVPEYQRGSDRWWRPQQEVLRRSLVLDGTGQAVVEIPTPFGENQDWEYSIQARVIDAARREVSGIGQVMVRRQAYAVVLECDKRIVRPGQVAEVRVRAEDSNGAPAVVKGRLTLERARHSEIWRDPAGKEWSGSGLSSWRRDDGGLPPGWWCVQQGYRFEELASIDLALNPDGRGLWQPNLPAAGTYVLRWRSDDPKSGPVLAETWIYAADENTQQLDLKTQGLSILLDASSLAEGEEAALLILTDSSDRHVLFTLSAERLIEARVLHTTGTTKLVRVPLDQRHVPQVRVQVATVRAGMVQRAQAELVVAPTSHFLEIKQKFDRELYRPGETGQLELILTDSQGRPVAGELSVSVYDAAVAAIAPERRPDPRAFFFAHPRRFLLSSGSSLERLPYFVSGEAETRDQLGMLGYLEGDSADVKSKMSLGRSRGLRQANEAVGAPAAMSAERSMADSDSGVREEGLVAGLPVGGGLGLGEQPGSPVVVVRSDFRETALWMADVRTDASGRAQVEVPFSEATTRWNLSTSATTQGADFGDLRAGPARTSLPLVARLALPRFAVVGDQFLVGGLVTNNHSEPIEVTLELLVEGLERGAAVLSNGPADIGTPVVRTIAPGATERVDFALRATQAGQAKLTLKASGGGFGDGLERYLPIEAHGLDLLLADAGRLDAGKLERSIRVPAAQPGSVRIEVLVTPEPALAALDALPYLTHFPYGCLEQTLSRFVPSAVAMGALARLGLTAEQVASAAFGGLERAHLSMTQPLGQEDFANWQRAAKEGLDKVLAWQMPEGGWSWWPGGGEDLWMSAYASWSLCLARSAGLEVPTGALERAADFLERRLVEAETRPDLCGWLLFALVELNQTLERSPSENFKRSFGVAYAQRGIDSASLRAFLCRAAKHLGAANELRILLDNLFNGVIRDEDPSAGQLGQRQGIAATGRLPRVHWGQAGLCWRWSNSAVESTAFVLMALLECAPEHELIDPALQWLVQNRRAGQWRSTRETAIAVLALSKRIAAGGGRAAAQGYILRIDGQEVARVEPGADLLGCVARGELLDLSAGEHRIEIERTAGEGSLFWTSGVRYFSLEEPIPAAANELFIERQYYRLVQRETLLAGRLFERRLLTSGAAVNSGDRIEVVLLLEPKSDLEYLLVEDLKPAGLEATELQSGGALYAVELSRKEAAYRFGELPPLPILAAGDGALRPNGSYTGGQAFCYRELRDRKVALFIDRLPEGLWELRYTLRAETPGTFHALPAVGQAMYVPEIRGNSVESRLEVQAVSE